MKEQKTDVITLTDTYVNSFLVPVKDGWCLIDTGYRQREKVFWKNLQKHSIQPEEIKYVVLTHHHADHAGFMQSVLDKTGATLISAPENAARLAAGKNDMETFISSFPILIMSKISVMFVRLTQCFPPVTAPAVDPRTQPLLNDGITFTVLKGHTECDVVVRYKNILFCGDLFMSGSGACKYAPMWIKNKFQMVDSWKTVREMDMEYIYPGHGKPFSASKLPAIIKFWSHRGAFPLRSR